MSSLIQLAMVSRDAALISLHIHVLPDRIFEILTNDQHARMYR